MARTTLWFRQFDFWLLGAITLLVGLGMLVIFSTTVSDEGYRSINVQGLALVLGIFVLSFLSALDYRYLKNLSYILYVLTIVVLVLLLFFGKTVKGTTGWFNLGFIQVQPSEFAKVTMLLVLARYFSWCVGRPSRLQFVIVSGILVGIPTIITMLQPEFGSALLLVFMWLGMLLFTGIKRNYVIALVVVFLVTALLGWNFFLQDYQKERIMTFMQPQDDPLGAGWNMNQAIIAVGSGGLIGRGLGEGSQSQLDFLPEQHTDFIFAVIAEELGLVGTLAVIILFAFLLYRMLRIAYRARDDFGLMLAIGASVLLIAQITLNIGMNLGILPIAGVPLPLVSSGGSALLAMMMIFGILQSVIIRHKGVVFK
ncbi:MAG: rod shape-determining protein RodA [bacterium]